MEGLMSLKKYGVLKGWPVEGSPERDGDTPHYQVLIDVDGQKHRIAVNVRSRQFPSNLLYFINDRFEHPILAPLADLPFGFTPIAPEPGGLALDYIRGNLFLPSEMQQLPPDAP